MANLNIIPEECADEAAIGAAQVHAILKDQKDVAEAMPLDEVDEMTEQLTKTTTRDRSRYTYNGILRVRQLALGCESN